MRCYIERRGQGRPLVFVHGWGFTGSIWDEFIGELTQEYEVFVVDLPGCGRSPRGSQYHSLADLAASIVNGVPTGARWIGWSFGGLVALSVDRRIRVARERGSTVSPEQDGGPRFSYTRRPRSLNSGPCCRSSDALVSAFMHPRHRWRGACTFYLASARDPAGVARVF